MKPKVLSVCMWTIVVTVIFLLVFWQFRFYFCELRIGEPLHNPLQPIQTEPRKQDVKVIEEETRMKSAFEHIYKSSVWGKYQGKPYSGGGSTPNRTVGYRKFVEGFLMDKNIRSVVDVPCGVWTFSQLIHWGPVKKYVGVDIAQYAVDVNRQLTNHTNFLQQNKGKTSFVFWRGSLTSEGDVPGADVLLCKDALQHISNFAIATFLHHVLPPAHSPQKCKYKYLLITNDVVNNQTKNKDIQSGGWRHLDIRLPPFNIREAVQVFHDEYKKATLLIDLTKPPWRCTHFDETLNRAPTSTHHCLVCLVLANLVLVLCLHFSTE